MSEINTKGNRNKVVVNSTVAIVAVLIAIVAIVWILGDRNDETQQGDNTTPTITTTDETRTTETAPTTENRKEIDKQIAAAIAEAEELAASGDYNAAISQIQTWLKTYSDSEKLQEKLAEYTTARNTQIKVDAIAAADELRNQGNYLDALLTIRQAIAEIGEDDDLTTQATTCESAYATIVSQQVDEFQQKMSISEAKELLREALEHVPENELLISRMTEMESYKTVPLDTLSPINGGFTWNDGTPADPFGSDYSSVRNYTIYDGDYCPGDYWGYAEYKIDQQYDVLSLNISPYEDFGTNAGSYVQVYADSVLRYVSPVITQKSGITNQEIDVSGVTYLKIYISKGEHGCLMLSDVVLQSIPGYESSYPLGITSVRTVDLLNGDFSWETKAPKNIMNDNYENVANYTVCDGDYCPGDYTLYEEYQLFGKYKSVSLDIAPYSDFGQNAVSCVKVYAYDDATQDWTLKYTSPGITQKTARFNTGEIDMTNVNYMKIEVEKDEYGCVILSDVLLKNAE